MHRSQQKIIFCLLLVLLLCAPAAAFVPEEQELDAGVRASYRGLKSWQAVITFEEEPGLTLDLWFSGRKWRQEWTAPGGNGTAASVGVGPNILASCPEGDSPLPVMLYWLTPRPVDIWKQLGVDNATAGFGFCDDVPCFTFGAEPGDDLRPQVRLNNETKALLLLRFNNNGQPVQFSFEEYATFKGFELPRKGMVIFADGSGLPFAIEWKDINKAADDVLYSPEGFNSDFSGTECIMNSSVFRKLQEVFNSINLSP